MTTTIDEQYIHRLGKIEKDLSQLVLLIADETANRRVFEERMANALVTFSEVSKQTATLLQKQHDTELFLAKDVATIADRKKLHLRIDAIEDGQRKNTWILNGGVHVVWLVVSAVIGIVSYKFKG